MQGEGGVPLIILSLWSNGTQWQSIGIELNLLVYHCGGLRHSHRTVTQGMGVESGGGWSRHTLHQGIGSRLVSCLVSRFLARCAGRARAKLTEYPRDMCTWHPQ